MYIGLSDTIEFASKLTLKRIINGLLVHLSYAFAKYTKRIRILGLPVSISVEPTTACNLGCPECPSGLRSFTRSTGRIAVPFFQSLIDELSDTLCYLTLYFQGEPYLHPQFLLLVEYARKKKIYTSTSTNAHFLTDEVAKKTVESGLNRLIISIDGTTQEVYESYRKNGELSKVIEGTKQMIKWKNKLKSTTPSIIWQFLVVRPNEHQIPDILQMAKSIGVNKVAFKTAQVYDYKNGHDLIPESPQYSRYQRNQDGSYNLKGTFGNECRRMWQSAVITWDGQVVPCCFDKDAHHPMGSLLAASFRDIWFSSSYQLFRKSIFNARDQIEMCQNCTEGVKVWA